VTALTTDPNVVEVEGGYLVRRSDGSFRMVLPRMEHEPAKFAVYSGASTFEVREPRLGYPGSWGGLSHAIAWAKEASCD
jgi:hypothetical protein